MSSFRMFSQEGWRRTGVNNLVLVSMLGTILFITLMISITRTDSPLSGATIFYDGQCDDTARINLALHLAINLVSSAVLASSNFFMQVLSAPSREELDRAHLYLRSLDIGLPSVKNIRFVSRFKRVCWLVFLLSSFPIHLLFNSSVFETNYQGSDWHLTIATEAFVHGTPFYAPGASLAPAGASSPVLDFVPATDYDGQYEAGVYILRYSTVDGNETYFSMGYGDAVDIAEYWDDSSEPRKNLTATANAASSWVRLEPHDCLAEYRVCKPRRGYRDVVIVVESEANNPTGWMRSEVFHFDPASNLSSFWDPHVPPGIANPLWYSTQCSTQRTIISDPNVKDYSCDYSCAGALGVGVDGSTLLKVNDAIPSDTNWTLPLQFESGWLPANLVKELGYNESFNNANVKYCLAMPSPVLCKIGLSNTLLLVVVVCLIIKVIQAAVVVLKLSSLSLVTPGDAIESFILNPDPRTAGLGSLDIVDSQRLEYAVRESWPSEVGTELTPLKRPRPWRQKRHRLFYTIPRAVWWRTYFVFLVAMVPLIMGLGFSISPGGTELSLPFGYSDENVETGIEGNSGYLGILLLANVPQVLVSLSYFSYNAFLTRLAIEREWNSFSLSHTPLRVSYPKGAQVSSYRLQLPYKYSIPLLGVSVLLHWLVSNSIFLFIDEGGYWTEGGSSRQSMGHQFGVSDDSVVALGYSPPAIFTLFIVCLVLIMLPLIFSLRKVKGNMVAGGYNSLVLSAACHTIPRSVSAKVAPSAIPNKDSLDTTRSLRERRPLVSNTSLSEEEEQDDLRNLSRSKLRWGAVAMPPEYTEMMYIEPGETVMHLTFGSEEDDVAEPEDGQLYI